MDGYGKSSKRGGALTFLVILAGFLLTVGLFVLLFRWYGQSYAGVEYEKTYYFLVRDCEDTTAAAVSGEVYFSGGAGYLLETGGRSRIVLACYFNETDAEYIRSELAEKGVETSICALAPSGFSLGGERAKEKERVLANLNTAESLAKLLYDTANGLERTSLSQEEARSALKGIVQVLKGLQRENENDLYERWNGALGGCVRRGIEISEGILFAKDLRYFQVQLCLMIVEAGSYFS